MPGTRDPQSSAPPDGRGGGRLDPLFLRRLLRWLWARVHGLYAAGGMLLVAGFAIALLGLWGLSGLTEEVVEGETTRFDESILVWLSTHASDRLDGYALELTSLGGWLVVLTITIVVATLLAFLERKWYALLVCVSVGGGWIIGPVLKAMFDRARPDVVEWRVPHAGHSSFPSGHSTMGMVLFITLAYVIHRIAGRAWVSVLSIGVGTLVVLAIGVTRVYLGVHYPSDVLAGYAIGFAWAMFSAAGVELLRSERMKTGSSDAPPEQPPATPTHSAESEA
jgi:undecaprenyl-diphosphatase